MREITPGIVHWTTFHEGIGMDVSSYFVPAAGALIDPREPVDGVDTVASYGQPDRALLTNRHHLRHAARYREAFGYLMILAHEAGMHEFVDGTPEVTPFKFGDEVGPGIVALEVGAICPDETCFHIDHAGGALAFADGLVHFSEDIGFVPDGLLGDDPEGVKAGLRAAAERLLDEPFEHLLFAHGDPIVGRGREALEQFVASHHG
jgi:hypothetical protein